MLWKRKSEKPSLLTKTENQTKLEKTRKLRKTPKPKNRSFKCENRNSALLFVTQLTGIPCLWLMTCSSDNRAINILTKIYVVHRTVFLTSMISLALLRDDYNGLYSSEFSDIFRNGKQDTRNAKTVIDNFCQFVKCSLI